MNATTTRTLNPLPFQDLEPHRFEDLVRQLAYDLRAWKSLEATGRSGSDDGLDIRAIEAAAVERDDHDSDEDGSTSPSPPAQERLWIFQCKREKQLGATRLRAVVAESLSSLAAPPHGFVLAVAADLSKKSRDAFREEMVHRGIEEFALWARGELEDMLFQPKNDRLLFAYFGLSLTPRRRSRATEVRASIATKKQLTALLGDENMHGKLVLLRDPSEERYPDAPKGSEPPPRWSLVRAITARSPGHLVVLHKEHLAALTADGKQWDAVLDVDVAPIHARAELRSANAWGLDQSETPERGPHGFWNEYIPEEDRAYLKIFRYVPLAQIAAIDPLGDGHFPVPHIFVHFDNANGPFSDKSRRLLEPQGVPGGQLKLTPDSSNRTKIFPHPLPSAGEPPESGFDDTSTEVATLSPGLDQRMLDLFGVLVANVPGDSTENAAPDVAQLRTLRRLSFRAWAASVARPVFSAFVARIRSSGHRARIAIKQVDPTPDGDGADSIELRVQLKAPLPHNPSYRRQGHVKISLPPYGTWRLDVFPPQTSGERSPQALPPKLEDVTQGHLEGMMVAMLEQLVSRGY